jgi:hypothetical protein
MKTSELTGAALDWAVAKAEGKTPKIQCTSFRDAFIYRVYLGWSYEHSISGSIVEYRPSKDWAEGGPIIEREGIELQCNTSALQAAAYKNANPDWFACLKFKRADHWHGTTPLIAAMRCYVASKLGDDIDVPKELL